MACSRITRCYTSLERKKNRVAGKINFPGNPFMSKEPTRPPEYHAQEKPDFEEQPESAPAGGPSEFPDKRLVKADICFSTFLPLHFLQTTLSASEIDDTKVSKTVSQSLQRYS